jgi:hypothetical protein
VAYPPQPFTPLERFAVYGADAADRATLARRLTTRRPDGPAAYFRTAAVAAATEAVLPLSLPLPGGDGGTLDDPGDAWWASGD